MSKTLYFFDIDGCTMPSIFPNDLFYNTDIEKLDIIIKAYQEAKRLYWDWKSNGTGLYPNFVEFYKEISKEKPVITFITGRQRDIFGWLTRWQLKPLNDINNYYDVEYFPSELNHTKQRYIDFKNVSIGELVPTKRFAGILNIFDDNNDYFQDLKNQFHLAKMNCCLMKSNEDWELMLTKLKNGEM